MRAPLFIDDNGDLMAFDTAEAAARYLEGIDVDEGVYVGYDATGAPLTLQTAPATWSRRVVVVEASAEPTRGADLTRLLEKRLRATGIEIDDATLEALVPLARDQFRVR